eukprot:TRINITY_DN40940_c0_g1_i1.p1 TRINITY_DN40940_c0_g1~~TRINITY_DN40940_c0_g1_i1.p1  ORF type:complete len:157 (-),score=11.07 TRINITY_DN40940_c0_g1_i1:158-628(-)
MEAGDCDIPGHVGPALRIVDSLEKLTASSNTHSISDFGGGRVPSLQYNTYDGAGNIVSFTHGFLNYFDLSMPVALPKTDWVISFEVGEHIPNMYEGMVIRNLHYHNCNGIVLSWAVIRQGGWNHINCHSNDYLIGIFSDLGYIHDKSTSSIFRNPN